MPVAHILMDPAPTERYDAFAEGLKKSGFLISKQPHAGRGCVLVCWNRFAHKNVVASEYDAIGAAVIVAENRYCGADDNGGSLYALARDQHNGAGRWTVDEAPRPLNIELEPWRAGGKHILVLPQRGIGPRGIAMPHNWAIDVVKKLQKLTDRPIRVRPHPGLAKIALKPDLESCWAAVTWGSGAAIKAIVAGIPVFHEFDRWIGAPAARFGIGSIEDPFLGDRGPMLHRLSYAQWSLPEIATGEPFKRLLRL